MKRFHPNAWLLLLPVIVAACSSGGGTGGAGVGDPTALVTIAPTSASVATGTTKAFVATVTNTSDTSVSWQVNGTTGGDPTVGTISTDGLYSAPANPPSTAQPS